MIGDLHEVVPAIVAALRASDAGSRRAPRTRAPRPRLPRRRALARLYLAVFGPLGLERPVAGEGERGEPIHYLRFPETGSGSLGLRRAFGTEALQPFELYAPGLHHVSFAVETAAEVAQAHAAAGAEILRAPQTWPQGPRRSRD